MQSLKDCTESILSFLHLHTVPCIHGSDVCIAFVLQAAFAKRMLAVVAGAGDSGLAMGMLCLLQRMLR